ncbi:MULTISPECIES: hypothetical protein [unclassified Paenibacillus]|uniref:hypothetical protein n=1 Tax=unclassified Paenibacillus TaxID=185978 RepID=UPI00034EB7F9|nr:MULTISPECIES: hypothetical protein [unclassified Paenibacillus]EPD82084.1 hypothetical protein HMPREF1207_03910 [Paenibacillus sp. HGH0039]
MKQYFMLLILVVLVLTGCSTDKQTYNLEKIQLITEGSQTIQADGNKLVMLEYQLTISGPSPIDTESAEISYGYSAHSKELVPINKGTLSLKSLCRRFAGGDGCKQENTTLAVRYPITFIPESPYKEDDLEYLKLHLDEIKFKLTIGGTEYDLTDKKGQ